jgi:hypothetical protein
MNNQKGSAHVLLVKRTHGVSDSLTQEVSQILAGTSHFITDLRPKLLGRYTVCC